MHRNTLTCKLTTPELQLRKSTILTELKNAALERIETHDGIKLKFKGSDDTIDMLTSFIKTERLCCDFFEFDLTVKDENEFAWLKLSGPEGAKEFIRTELGL